MSKRSSVFNSVVTRLPIGEVSELELELLKLTKLSLNFTYSCYTLLSRQKSFKSINGLPFLSLF